MKHKNLTEVIIAVLACIVIAAVNQAKAWTVSPEASNASATIGLPAGPKMPVTPASEASKITPKQPTDSIGTTSHGVSAQIALSEPRVSNLLLVDLALLSLMFVIPPKQRRNVLRINSPQI